MSDTDLPDINVLFALFNPAHVAHGIAQEWFADVPAFATTPITELGLLRLSMNPTLMGQQVPFAAAQRTLQSLRQDPRAVFTGDDATLAQPVIGLTGVQGHRQLTFFHLVNLAALHNMTLVTFDRHLAGGLLRQDHGRVRFLG